METTDIIAIVPLLIIVAILGIAIGMYITTQISDWIETRTQNKDLMINMNKMEGKGINKKLRKRKNG
jgi:phosphate/sulfate permease